MDVSLGQTELRAHFAPEGFSFSASASLQYHHPRRDRAELPHLSPFSALRKPRPSALQFVSRLGCSPTAYLPDTCTDLFFHRYPAAATTSTTPAPINKITAVLQYRRLRRGLRRGSALRRRVGREKKSIETIGKGPFTKFRLKRLFALMYAVGVRCLCVTGRMTIKRCGEGPIQTLRAQYENWR